MVDTEDRALLREVGPGKPVGELLRRYWQPALLSSDLPERDRPPIRVQLLGEKLVAFRDAYGRVGLVDASCPHQGLPMADGINANGRLSCYHHGWAFDVTGRCVDDMPGSDQVRIKAYPTVESAGIVWAYMGPPEAQPQPPVIDTGTVSAGDLAVARDLLRQTFVTAVAGQLAVACADMADGAPIEVRPTANGVELGARVPGMTGADEALVVAQTLPGHIAVTRRGKTARTVHLVPVDAWSTMSFTISTSAEPVHSPANDGATTPSSGVSMVNEGALATARLPFEALLLLCAGRLQQGEAIPAPDGATWTSS